MAEAKFLALDLGAESGRAVVGHFDGASLQLEEIHRFPNGPVLVNGHLYWDALRLLTELKAGIRLAAQKYGADLVSLGLDTWGVDYGLLDEQDNLLGNPYHYRDSRTDGMLDQVFEVVPREEVFEQTGIQFMQLNTLYQLYAMRRQGSPLLDMARTLLTMPDLFSFWLTGRKVSEFSIATTTQFYDPRARTWAVDLLRRLGLPTSILAEIVPPGTVLGDLLPEVADELVIDPIPVIAPACHDTGSAVAAVPAQERDYAYISSGTWSLMGVEVNEPVITPQSLEYNFTNEGGVCDTFRLLKNIMGLWLVQECRREWAREGVRYDYAMLTEMAAAAPAFGPIVDVDDHRFLSPGDMPNKIRQFCLETGQEVPESKGEVLRCALESLALRYRWVLERLEEMMGRTINVVHIIGGGMQNELLCQFGADAMRRPVIAGPIEATAMGNILMQALALGHIGSLEEGRAVVRRSFQVRTYEPVDAGPWEEAYDRYLRLLEQA
ncbi:MAG TPA: rhamnulokinase family protein [Anaerolineae bacterium]|nr:rhamnulokinase family protein [Anaerolineae bacterium]